MAVVGVMFPDLTRLQVSVAIGTPERKRERNDVHAIVPPEKKLCVEPTLRLQPHQALCDPARDRSRAPNPVLEFAQLPAVSEDPFLGDYKNAARTRLEARLTENAKWLWHEDEVDEVEPTLKIVRDIINDNASWKRQDYKNLARGTAVRLEAKHSKELVEALRSVEGYDPNWTFEHYKENNREISEWLVEGANSFFRGMVEGFNMASDRVQTDKPYIIHYRFDSTSFQFTDVFHMDDLENRREYGHGEQGVYFAPLESYTVSFCYDDALDHFKCGTEVLLGVPTLTQTAMYALSHTSGGRLNAQQLGLLWGSGVPIKPRPGEDAEWEKSAWQRLANIMQLCTEEVLKEKGEEMLRTQGGYALHKVQTNVLSDYAHYVYHRADATSADPANRDVRCFANIGQGGEVKDTEYYTTAIRLNDDTEVTIRVAWN